MNLLAAFLASAVLLPRPAAAQDAQIVAIAVRTEPSGATVRVNRLARTWTTPCDIADFTLKRGVIEVEVSLAGYVTTRRNVLYDGEIPVHLELKLQPVAVPAPAAPPPAPVPVPVPVPPAPAPKEPGVEKVPVPAPAPIPTPVQGGRLRVASATLAVRVTAGKAMLADGSRPSELLLPPGQSEKILVEFLDPKTGAVVGVVEVLPPAAAPSVPAPAVPPAPAPAPAPKPAPAPAPAPAPGPQAAEGDRVGQVQLVHRTYGVFVKLDPGLQVATGDEIVVVREGREVARAQIERVIQQDPRYPDGAVMIPAAEAVRKGDEVRRTVKP